ncbi:hypothetical protein AB1Y20_020039 [Prymnesium parvum]|uniref:protein disulfide-isomerase n=1 Tax=Prymnesium parvum TaxID=97485 RepID=A0AB34JSJ5_PRYPA
MLPLAAGAANVTSRNLTAALSRVGARGAFLGFSSPHCTYCAAHEPQYAAYAALAPDEALPPLLRVNAAREAALLRRHEVEELPALVLAWSHAWVHYTGAHHSASMAEFAASRLAPLVETLRGADALERVLEAERRPLDAELPARVLLLLFLRGVDDDDALDDLRLAARQLRSLRTDAPVRAAAVAAGAEVREEYGARRRWFSRAPAARLLLNGQLAGGEYLLDEADEPSAALGAWAARAALPLLGELKGATFAAYAATGLPMLLAFVHPRADSAALRRALRGVARRFRERLTAAWCDGERHEARMLALGLQPGVLPQVAINTQDGRRLPYAHGQPLTEQRLSQFVADFLGERLPPLPPPPPAPPAAEAPRGVVELAPDSFERAALDVRRDVLLQLYASRGCEACDRLTIYYSKVAERFAELHVDSVLVARLDVSRHPLPPHLKSVQLHSLPIILALPARRKDPPFAQFDGNARPKEMMYFLQRHASHPFELPPNPHLTREQHAMWKDQVAGLPREKVESAYEKLQRETGLTRDEL